MGEGASGFGGDFGGEGAVLEVPFHEAGPVFDALGKEDTAVAVGTEKAGEPFAEGAEGGVGGGLGEDAVEAGFLVEGADGAQVGAAGLFDEEGGVVFDEDVEIPVAATGFEDADTAGEDAFGGDEGVVEEEGDEVGGGEVHLCVWAGESGEGGVGRVESYILEMFRALDEVERLEGRD